MAGATLPREAHAAILHHAKTGMTNVDIGTALGLNRGTVAKYRNVPLDGFDAPPPPADFEIPKLPSNMPTVAELLSRRAKEFTQRDTYERAAKLVRCKVKLDGPVGIVHFGDPHVDDPGCDILQLQRHVKIVQDTPGMFGANIGDASNNWVGRLAQLHANQSVKAKEAWILVGWMVRAVRWLYFVGGNHDMWSGDRDILGWMADQAGVLYKPHGIRIALEFPGGKEVRINARHDHKGHSMYNNAHGPMKGALMGMKDHIVIAGHTHTCGYGMLKDPSTGIISHCIRVGSYKVHDDFAQQGGFPDGNFSPACCTIINPDATEETALVQTHWNIETAADYLTFLRKKRRK